MGTSGIKIKHIERETRLYFNATGICNVQLSCEW